MRLEEGLYAWLTVQSGFSSLAGTRLYPMFRPQDSAVPAAVYVISGGDTPTCQSGTIGVSKATIDITCWAATYLGARAFAFAVKLLLAGYSGTWGTTVAIGHIEIHDSGDDYVEDRDEYGVVLACEIWYREA